MIGGNRHYAHGLFEFPEPYDFETPNEPLLSLPGRALLPYNVVRSSLARAMEPHQETMTSLASLFDCPMYHVLSPPPLRDGDLILKHVHRGDDSSLEAMTVAPAEFRMKVYNLQNKIVVEQCEQLGLKVINPPSETLDSDGFLRPEFMGFGATHGNEAYGRFLAKRLMELNNDC
ncbi:MAG: hypothetical protein AAFY02_04995 [Pseudomonadota bacterium]